MERLVYPNQPNQLKAPCEDVLFGSGWTVKVWLGKGTQSFWLINNVIWWIIQETPNYLCFSYLEMNLNQAIHLWEFLHHSLHLFLFIEKIYILFSHTHFAKETLRQPSTRAIRSTACWHLHTWRDHGRADANGGGVRGVGQCEGEHQLLHEWRHCYCAWWAAHEVAMRLQLCMMSSASPWRCSSMLKELKAELESVNSGAGGGERRQRAKWVKSKSRFLTLHDTSVMRKNNGRKLCTCAATPRQHSTQILDAVVTVSSPRVVLKKWQSMWLRGDARSARRRLSCQGIIWFYNQWPQTIRLQ